MLVGLIQVVQIEMGIAEGVDELARIEIADMGDEMGQERVARDVERNAEENIGAALVELARKPAVGDVELEQTVARRQGHRVELADIPRAYDEAPRVGFGADFLDHAGDLVHRRAVGLRPGAPLAPVDRPEFALPVRPFVPDPHPVLVEVADIGVAREEPEELVDDRRAMQALGGQQGKPVREVEAHLVAEHASRSRSRAVAPHDATVADMAHQIEILAHPTPRTSTPRQV